MSKTASGRGRVAAGLCVGLFLGLFVVGDCLAGDKGEVNAALKRVTKALKGVVGVVAEVEYAEVVRGRPIGGKGTLSVNLDGRMRAEVAGSSPRTVLLSPPFLYMHRKPDKTVEVHNLSSNPHLLAQYALLGFLPAGKALKKHYEVELVDDARLGDEPVLSFLLAPKSDEVREAIARIQLWVDPETGLPLRQKVVHALAETDLEIRYLDTTVQDAFDASTFLPVWPEGTDVVRMN